jgi:hypothetical protein
MQDDQPGDRLMIPAETADTLRRILQAVEGKERKRWVEISCAIVLSLATMASAWCAYQSTLWGGVQTFRLAAAGKAGRQSSVSSVEALQLRAFDASMFMEFIKARARDEKELERFLSDRFRPELRVAMDAWLATKPFENPEAPRGPFRMAAYQQPEEKISREQDEEAGRQMRVAQEANETSDTYVLLTVLFASVLFFGGIGASFESRRLRIFMALLALVLFTVTVGFLATMPICRE